jgi:hypothetical protein
MTPRADSITLDGNVEKPLALGVLGGAVLSVGGQVM